MATGYKDPDTKEDNPIQERYNNDSGLYQPTSDLDAEENSPQKDLSGVSEDEKQRLRGIAQSDQDQASNLYGSSSSESNGPQKAKFDLKSLAAGKRKYGLIGGGIAGIIATLILFFFPTLAPLSLLNNLFDHNFEYNNSFRRQRTGTIMDTIFGANRTNRDLQDTPFKSKVELIAFEKFEARMQSRGWDFDYNADGKPIGLIDPDGQRIDLDGLTKSEFKTRVQPVIDDVIPAYRMRMRTETRQLISTFTGPAKSFKWTHLFSPEARQQEPDFTKRQYLKEAGVDTAPDNVDVDIDYGDADGNPVDVDDPSLNALDETSQIIIDELDAGTPKSEATTKAVEHATKKITGERVAALSTIALVGGCMAYSVYSQDLLGDYSRYSSAMRIGAAFMLGVNEVYDGNNAVDPEDFGEFVSAYANEDGNFAAARAVERSVGKDPVGPELADELYVIEGASGSENFLETSLEGLGSVVAELGIVASAVCFVVGSEIFAYVGSAIDLGVRIAGCVLSAGFGCAVSLSSFAAQEILFYNIGRMVAASVQNAIGFVVADPVQAANMLDQALSLIESEDTLTATPVTSTVYNQKSAEYFAQVNREKPLRERYISADNPRSLLAQLTFKLNDFDAQSINQKIASIFTAPILAITDVLGGNRAMAQAEFNNYGFQKRTFDNAYLDSDPNELAKEVNALLKADTQVATRASEASGNLARDFSVICMGYDPDREIIDSSPSSKRLGKYSDPEAYGEGTAKIRNELYQKVCVDEANAQLDLYSKVGRFVDDIDLICGVVKLSDNNCLPKPVSAPVGGGIGGGDTEPVDVEAACGALGLGFTFDEIGAGYCIDDFNKQCAPDDIVIDPDGKKRCGFFERPPETPECIPGEPC